MKTHFLLFATASALASLSSVRADSALFLSDGIHNLTILDGAANDSNPLAGVVTFNGLLDPNSPWTVNVTTGISRPVLGNANSPFLDLNSVNVSSSGGGTLIIEFSDTGFGPITAGTLTTEIGGSTGGSATFRTWADSGNALFGKTTTLADLAFSSTPFSAAVLSERPTTNPFSLTLQTTITHTGGEVTSFNGSLYDSSIRPSVPEPSTVSLIGLGLVGGLWVASRSRKNKAA